MATYRGGTFMKEKRAEPKASETDPPAANQPLGDDEAAAPTSSDRTPQVVPGKPDGEVDTRP